MVESYLLYRGSHMSLVNKMGPFNASEIKGYDIFYIQTKEMNMNGAEESTEDNSDVKSMNL
jgi:hypothetical protein